MVEKKQPIIKHTQEHRTKKRDRAATNQINQHKPLPFNISMRHLFIICLLFIIVQNNNLLERFYLTNHNHNQVLAYNIDTQSAIVHHGPEKSYFGYTVAQHKDRNTSWVLVGAPKAQTDQRNVLEGGAVFKCSPTTSRACQQIPFDSNGPSILQLKNETKQSDEKSHQWFGASLQSATENGSIVACAPLYVYFSSSLRRRDPVGTCWISRGSFGGFLEYSPCRLNEQWGHHHMGSCQAGFSSAITKDGSRLFMGAPGSHVWQGQAFAHNLRTDLSNSTSAVNPHSEDDSYLGYSMTVGRFSSGSGGVESDLAIGIPHGSDLLGKVMIVDREMRTLRNITGEQMGAYFGYSLATADINGDGFDDLLIGAPLYYNQTISHKEPHFERGRVYVALQNHRQEFDLHQRLDGHKNKARFGTSIANCGDLNRDGYQDIAVGAPYDGPEQHGAVYIFMGHKKGLSEEYDQVIYAEMLPRNEGNQMRSFGFSLSGGLDLDSNLYPDLLVGDYEANRAVVLRTRPVVYVNSSLTFTPDHFNLDEKKCILPNSTITVPCITIQYCTKYNGFNVDNRLNFVYDIKLDTQNKGAPRLFLLNNPGSNELLNNQTTLYRDTEQCHSFKAYIARDIRDKLTPLKVDIDYNLPPENTNQVFDYSAGVMKLKPVLNKSNNQNRMSKLAAIQKNCGSEGICVPDLKLTMNSNIYEYTIGTNEKLILDVTVKNNGEDAFESTFYLTMPMTINYNTFNSTRTDYPICYKTKPDETGVNILTCDLGNPLVHNDVLKFSIITEPARGQFTSSDFTFIGVVNSTNPEFDDKHREDNSVAIGISIKVDVNLVLSGSSVQPIVHHNSTLSQLNSADGNSKVSRPFYSVADLGEEVHHNYQLHNKGPSTINDIAVTILWPSKTSNGKCLLYLVDDPITNDKVRCKPLSPGEINPNNLKYLQGNSINSSDSTSALNSNYYYSSTNNQQYYSQFNQRHKRQSGSNTKQEIKTTTVDNSIIIEQSNLLSCDPTRCTRFECNVFDLGNNEIATIKIRSRLCKETLDYLSKKDYDISSKLVAQIKSLPYNVSSLLMPPYTYKVTTQVRTTGLAVQDLLPWWVILLAILLGIALFILLACFLKYLGFFARKRPPKNTEREPLTPTIWNDYQYTPGDTAL